MSLLLLLIVNKILLIKMIKTYCLGGRHISNTDNIVEYEKVNSKIKKLVKIIKGTCSICGRNKSKIFTK